MNMTLTPEEERAEIELREQEALARPELGLTKRLIRCSMHRWSAQLATNLAEAEKPPTLRQVAAQLGGRSKLTPAQIKILKDYFPK